VYISQKQLALNEEKCKYLIMSNKNPTQHNNLILKGKSLERVIEFSYLGLIIDQKLKFKGLFNYTYQSCIKKLININRKRKYLTEEITFSLINAIVFSILNYGIEIYYHHLNNEEQIKLENLFDFSLKIINSESKHTIKEKYKILNVEERFKYFAVKWINKHTCNNNQQNIFIKNEKKYETRNTNAFKHFNFKKLAGVNSMFNKGLKEYHLIIPKIKKTNNESDFKKSLKRTILELN